MPHVADRARVGPRRGAGGQTGGAGKGGRDTVVPRRHPRVRVRDSTPGESPVTCRELASFMLDYVSGELPREQVDAFDHHLTLCVNCRRYLGQYRETIGAGRAAFSDPDGPVPAEVPEELVRAI